MVTNKENIMKYNCLVSLILVLFFSSMNAFAEPASKESVKALMERTGSGKLGVQMMKQMLPSLKKMIPDAPEEFWANMIKEMNAEEVVELVIPVYQKHFTEEDIREINTFYDTAAGKKMIRVLPEIMQESMVIGQQWGQKIARDILNKYKARTEAESKP